jgi:hypothetical protein
MINHLTFTGRYAGITYCGRPRNELCAHLPVNLGGLSLKDWLEKHVICLECRKIALSDE